MLTHVFVPLTILSRGFLFGGLESFTILAETKRKNMKKLFITLARVLLSIFISALILLIFSLIAILIHFILNLFSPLTSIIAIISLIIIFFSVIAYYNIKDKLF